MMAKSAANKSSILLRLVEEEALSKNESEEEERKQQRNLGCHLPKDCISDILVRLPLESLQRSRLVCKPWNKIVSSHVFIDAKLCRSETVLIFLSPDRDEAFQPDSMTSIPEEKPHTFSVEDKLFPLQTINIFQKSLTTSKLKFMEIKDGKSNIGEFNATCMGEIRATCNGLILLDYETGQTFRKRNRTINNTKKGALIVMNPVTKDLTALPLGTLYPAHNESYGIAFCKCTKEYKVVHLFWNEMQYIGCEILRLGTRSWREVDGPSFGLFSWFRYEPVSAIGALHWLPHVDHSEYLVSMEMDEEKFHKIMLPRSSGTCDRIVEMGGVLCFVTRAEMNQIIEVWVLGKFCGEDWSKKHTIRMSCMRYMTPLYCSRLKDEMILVDKDGSVFSYDFQFQVMTMVEMEEGCFSLRDCHGSYLPHVNSVVSWQIREKGQDVDD